MKRSETILIGTLKAEEKSKLKDTKQDYVSWLQSRAMVSRWLKQVGRKVAREVGRGDRGTLSHSEALEGNGEN